MAFIITDDIRSDSLMPRLKTPDWEVQANALVIQGWKAIREQGGPGRSGMKCVYQNLATGSKCVVGHLLRQEEYSLRLEGENVENLSMKRLLPARLEPFVPVLYEMQKAHDNSPADATFLHHFAFKLLQICSSFGLKVAYRTIEADFAKLGARPYDHTERATYSSPPMAWESPWPASEWTAKMAISRPLPVKQSVVHEWESDLGLRPFKKAVRKIIDFV